MVPSPGTPVRADRLRALNLPLAIDVGVDEHGTPVAVVERDEADLAVRRGVLDVVEEWRIDDEWWRRPIARRYVEVVLEGGAHVVVFEDEGTGEWFLQQP